MATPSQIYQAHQVLFDNVFTVILAMQLGHEFMDKMEALYENDIW